MVPYRSAGEFYFNRGVGATIQKGNIEATAFASYKRISGNVVNDTSERFTSLLTSGYYRNASEIADKNKIRLTSFGGNINYQNKKLKNAEQGFLIYTEGSYEWKKLTTNLRL